MEIDNCYQCDEGRSMKFPPSMWRCGLCDTTTYESRQGFPAWCPLLKDENIEEDNISGK